MKARRDIGRQDLVLLGLTGSIGMGKSETARMFRAEGVPVFDSDAEVHRLMGLGGEAVEKVEAAFPGVATGAAGSGQVSRNVSRNIPLDIAGKPCGKMIDRKLLGQRVFGDEAALRRLEKILHPLVSAARHNFIRLKYAQGHRLIVLDVPLLFETGGDRLCDYTVVVTAPAFIQRQRALARPGMTAERFWLILEKQMPDAQKRRRADFIIQTGLGKRYAREQVRRLVRYLSGV